MTAYAGANLENVNLGDEIVEYLRRIDATLTLFAGSSIVHGGPKDVMEGEWPGDLVVIAFPDREHAKPRYASPQHQAILPLRQRNARGRAIIIDGVDETHRAIDVLG